MEAVGTLDPYSRVEAETMAWSEGLKTEPNDQTGIYVSEIHDGDYLQVRSVDFGDKGADSVTVAVASALRGGAIDIYSGDCTGQLIASIKVSPTGGWEKWTTITARLTSSLTSSTICHFASEGKRDVNFLILIIGNSIANEHRYTHE